MIRKAEEKDVAAVFKIYEKLLDIEESGRGCTCWARGIYPTLSTAQNAFLKGDLFVYEEDGNIAAAAIINKDQPLLYSDCHWKYEAEPEKVTVLHTLVVDPDFSGRGIGKSFVKFYEDFARQNGSEVLRMDTNEKNIPARTLYKKLGYREAGTVKGEFNGMDNIHLVCLEKKPNI